jgi:hypothetical protein
VLRVNKAPPNHSIFRGNDDLYRMYHSFQVGRQQGIHGTLPIRPSVSLDETIVLWPPDTFFGVGRAVSLSAFFSWRMVSPPGWSGKLRLARRLRLDCGAAAARSPAPSRPKWVSSSSLAAVGHSGTGKWPMEAMVTGPASASSSMSSLVRENRPEHLFQA